MCSVRSIFAVLLGLLWATAAILVWRLAGVDSDLVVLVHEQPEIARRRLDALLDGTLEQLARGETIDLPLQRAAPAAHRLRELWRDPSYHKAIERYRAFSPDDALRSWSATKAAVDAETAYRRGDTQQAEHNATAALALFRQAGDPRGELRALHLLGNVAMVSHRTREALELYSRLKALAAAQGNPSRAAAAVNNLATLAEHAGRLGDAEEGYRNGDRMGRVHGLPRVRAFAQLYLGNLYHRLGMTELAPSLFLEAETAFRTLGEIRSEAVAASNRGASLQQLGELDAALRCFRHALRLRATEADPQGRLATGVQLAELLLERGERDAAMATVRHILAEAREDDPRFRYVRWAALLVGGDALRYGGDLQGARSHYHEALEIVSEIGRQLDRAVTLERDARLLASEGRTEDAVGRLREAAVLVEALRSEAADESERIHLLRTLRSVYAELGRTHLNAIRNPGEALGFFERARARAFLDVLEGGGIPVLDENGARVRLRASAQPVSLEELVAQLDEGTLLLHFTQGVDWVALLAVSHLGIERVREIPVSPGEVRRLVRELLDEVGRPPETGRPLGRTAGVPPRLGEILLSALDGLREPYQRLVVVPDGDLATLPWPALRWKGRYLVEDHEIVLAPSASSYVRLGKESRQAGPGTALVVAQRLGGGSRPLLEAEDEARVIASLFPGSELLRGEEAREETVGRAMKDHDIVHFAAHARVVPERPWASGLALHPDRSGTPSPHVTPRPGDGWLSGFEILQTRLRSGTLVTLAACETLGGGARQGEGVVGLARAFLEAGASAVVGSLWAVDDDATRALMTRFYVDLSGAKVSAAGALAASQRALARGEAGERRRHPYHWAGFVLVGGAR